MAKEAARKTILSLNSTPLAGVQTKSVAVNKVPIDRDRRQLGRLA